MLTVPTQHHHSYLRDRYPVLMNILSMSCLSTFICEGISVHSLEICITMLLVNACSMPMCALDAVVITVLPRMLFVSVNNSYLDDSD